MTNARSVEKKLRRLASPARAKASARYFKTGKGEYGYGDAFIGVSVPNQRAVAKQFKALPLVEIRKLLRSKVHECRQTALFILVGQYKKASGSDRDHLARFYLNHRRFVNNWDLVDSSAPYILGTHLLDKDRAVLYQLAREKVMWDRRIAVISTFAFIRENDFKDGLRIATLLLHDKHDLIHKAVGWMLRELGKKSLVVEERFLKKHVRVMPRTMLRYAIEKFPERKRRIYLSMG